MSRSELHNWECAIEELSGDNAEKMLAIAQDIYNTAFARGKNYTSLEHGSAHDKIRAEIADIYCGQYCENPLTADAVREMALEIIDKYTQKVRVENEHNN